MLHPGSLPVMCCALVTSTTAGGILARCCNHRVGPWSGASSPGRWGRVQSPPPLPENPSRSGPLTSCAAAPGATACLPSRSHNCSCSVPSARRTAHPRHAGAMPAPRPGSIASNGRTGFHPASHRTAH